MPKLILAALAAAVTFAGCDATSDESLAYSDLQQDEYLRVQVTGTTVIRDSGSWQRFWSSHVSTTGLDGALIAAPTVNFERQTVVGVFYGGSPRAGCASTVDVVRSVTEEGGVVQVSLGPLPDLGPCRAVVYPVDIVVVDVAPSMALDVRFVGDVPG